MHDILQKLKKVFFLVLLSSITIGVLILVLEITFPKMTTITMVQKVRVYPPENCRNKIDNIKIRNKAEKLACNGENPSYSICQEDFLFSYREMFEEEYYKQCVPQSKSYCFFDYHHVNNSGGAYGWDNSYQEHAYTFNPHSYYVTCYQEKTVNKKVRIPLLQRIKDTMWIKKIL
ncbi:hypothetical protein [Acinetobacter sp. ESBL14]|uniref:hypothetical protein n=1 Tax=Acinetobacter sp. ESBL14 TaxID=3077329 RepID=UPI002FC957A4